MQEKKTGSGYRWVILAVLCLTMFVGNFAQFQMSPIATRIISELGLTATEYSSVFSAPMAPAVIFSLVAGAIVDKLGVKRPIALSLVLSVAGLALRIFATNYGMLYASLFLIGFSTMMATVNGSKILSQWFPKEKVSIMLGVVLAAAAAGQTIGLAIGAAFETNRSAYMFAFIIGVVALVSWMVLIRERKPQADAVEQKAPPILASIKVVLHNHYVWIIGFCMMAIVASSVILSSMLPTALGERGVDSVTAGLIAAVFSIGSLVGNIIVPGLVARNGGKRRLILVILCVIYGLGLWQGWRAPLGVVQLVIMFASGFCMGGMGPVLSSMPLQMPDIGPVYAGTAGGVIATIQLLGPVAVVPYILTPIAGGSYSRFFGMGALLVVCLLILCLFLPASVAKTLRGSKRKK